MVYNSKGKDAQESNWDNLETIITLNNPEVKPELSDEDIKKLAEFFYFLWQLDERNKREGRYDVIPKN